ncbi:Demethylmenaquinone methyltransferase [Colletotrichum tanaceti]|uniref:Demethylmenaquinone methyltransferase n=1 Tax=Colletotrichum tanaceti TaxID=1306861 RepID=A0A4U6X4H8_9PEZI|nr:Demethylmenaquinone methyltransferase [Colletotrichum tanaceti]TKW49843.1 Demethylmenaquinone methyltransferase [Colletotrichum tanaceti]
MQDQTASETPSYSRRHSNPPVLNPAADKDNHTNVWTHPEVGRIYRNTEHVTAALVPPLLDACGLTEEAIASLKRPIEVLDMCCGAGVVSAQIQTILKRTGMANKGMVKLTCSDSSAGQMEYVKNRIQADGWVDSKVVKGDISCLPFESNSFDFVVVGAALMVVADPYTGLSELFRILKPGGRLATSTWGHEGWVAATCGAFADLSLPNQKPVPWPQESSDMTRLWSPGKWECDRFTAAMYNAAGFADVRSDTIPSPLLSFDSAEHFCTAYQTLHFGVMEKYWSKEQKEKLSPLLAETFIKYLRKKYDGGPFGFERSTVIASGTKPLK